MITFGHLLQRTKDFDGKVGTSYSHDIYADAVREAVREVWYAHDWQFHTGELVLPLLDGYSAGTVTVTNGSTKVTASSSATWATSWAKARFIRDGDDGDYTMKTFRESGGFWVGTLDAAYHFSTGSTQPYSLQFMEYDLPSDFLSLENPTRGTLFGGMAPISYHEWLDLRVTNVFAGIVTRYAIVQGDGNTNPRICFFPATQKQLIRAPYRKKPPEFYLYDDGVATVTNASAVMRGSATLWATTGFTVTGQVVEFHEDAPQVQNIVSSVNSATGITLSATWGGPTLSDKGYRISDRINVHDALKPAIVYKCFAKIAELRREVATMAHWDAKAEFEIRKAAAAIAPYQESFVKATPGEIDDCLDLPMPRVLQLADGDVV